MTSEKNLKKHPALAETRDIMLAILSGSFALFAIIFVWIKEVIYKKKA